MIKYNKTWLVALLLVFALLVSATPVMAAQAQRRPAVPRWAVGELAEDKQVTVIVELEDAPITELDDLTDLRPEIPPGMEEDGDWADTLAVDSYRAQLFEAQAALFERMDQEGMDYTVGFRYDTLLNGFSCDIAYGDIAGLMELDGVKDVFPVHCYDAPQAVYTAALDEYDPQMFTSQPTTGNSDMLSSGNRGEGTVVAVLDTGYRLNHPCFTDSGNPYLSSAALGSSSSVSSVTAYPAYRGKYYNQKIPFTCNYYDIAASGGRGTNITYGNDHGTHVAGIVGGYDPTGGFQGAAPGAQILAMQVFADSGGTNSSIYIKALEDALTLGADVVNMSLGSDCGFSVGSYNGVPTAEEQVFDRLRNAGVVVCISAGNSGSYMAPYSFPGDGTSQPYYDSKKDSYPSMPDYSTVSSPSTLCSNISVASANTTTDSRYRYSASDGRPQISDFSCRGPATTLDIRPTLTSIGGAVVSSYAKAGDTYRDEKTGQLLTYPDYVYMWGTSMSAPNLSGTFANLLSYLKKSSGGNISSKVTRGETAIALMESAADLVCGTASNADASVIQQGAGLGNAYKSMKAYQNGAYITNPIQELRDDPARTGVYTMTLQLKNATGSPVTLTPSTKVLTDKVLNGKNTQETRSVSANVTYTVSGSNVTRVTVPAGSTEEVKVTVSLTNPAMDTLDEEFPNGAYIQGFVTFTPTGSDAAPVHATYLAFYGDWSQVDSIEKFYMVDGEDIDVLHDESYIYLDFNDIKTGTGWSGKNLLPLGENPMDFWDENGTGYGSVADYDVKRAAIPGGYKTSTGKTNILYNGIVVWPTALRNMRGLSFSIQDPEGQLTYRGGSGYTAQMVTKAHALEDGTWPTAATFRWDGYSDGAGYSNCVPGTWWLNSGTEVVLHVDAETPYSRNGSSYEIQHHDYPIVIDHEDPTLDTSKVYFDPTDHTVTLPADDNHYVAAVYVMDVSNPEKVSDCILFDEDEPGTAVIAPRLSIRPDAKVGDTVQVRVMDYASNWVEENITLTYTAHFDLQGHGTDIEPVYGIEDGGTIAAPTAPQEDGYLFGGWFEDAACTRSFDFSTPITSNRVVYAKWTKLHTVNFHFGGKGGTDSTEIVPDGTPVASPEVASVVGYTMEGWFTSSSFSGSAYNFQTPVTGDLDLYAKWTRNRYTVAFNVKGHGVAVSDAQIYHGETVTRPTDPTETGYTFGGWFTDTDCTAAYDFETPITGPATLYAKWTRNRYTVTFAMKGHGSAVSDAQIYHGDKVTRPTDPTETGYTFGGWFTDNGCTVSCDFDAPVTGPMTLYAKWTRNRYTVTFDMKGHGADIDAVQVYHGDVVLLQSPSTVGYDFLGWYTASDLSGNAYIFTTPVTGPMTLYAKWTPKIYTVTIQDNGFATGLSSSQAEYDSVFPRPDDPAGDYYHRFGGWFTDAPCTTPYDFSSAITGNLTLYAKWLGLDDERGTEYIGVRATLRDPVTGQEIRGCPKGDFTAEVTVLNQSSIHAATDVFIIAVYDHQGKLLSARMNTSPAPQIGQNAQVVSGRVSNPTGKTITIKVFALSTLKGMVPLLGTTRFLYMGG